MSNTKKPSPKNEAPKQATPAVPTPPMSDTLAFMSISHFMTRKVKYVSTTTSVKTAVEMMITHKISGLPVVDVSEKCVGVYSELDAILQAASGPLDQKIKYSSPPLTVMADATFRDVLIQLVQKKVKRIPVVDQKNQLVGVISRKDFIRALFADDKKE